MNDASIRAVVRRALADVAPEADLDTLPPNAALRDELDLDSVDFLSFIIALHKALGVEIPESDYAKLTTLASTVAYLDAKVSSRGGPD